MSQCLTNVCLIWREKCMMGFRMPNRYWKFFLIHVFMRNKKSTYSKLSKISSLLPVFGVVQFQLYCRRLVFFHFVRLVFPDGQSSAFSGWFCVSETFNWYQSDTLRKNCSINNRLVFRCSLTAASIVFYSLHLARRLRLFQRPTLCSLCTDRGTRDRWIRHLPCPNQQQRQTRIRGGC